MNRRDFHELASMGILGSLLASTSKRPVASLKVSEGDSFKEALKNYTSNPDETFANSSFGYQFGVGVKVLGIQLDVRRQGSLYEISVLNLPNEPKFSQRAQGWQVTASFNIL